MIDFSGDNACGTQVNCAYDVKLDLSSGSPVVLKNLLIQQTGSTNYPSVGLDAAGRSARVARAGGRQTSGKRLVNVVVHGPTGRWTDTSNDYDKG